MGCGILGLVEVFGGGGGLLISSGYASPISPHSTQKILNLSNPFRCSGNILHLDVVVLLCFFYINLSRENILCEREGGGEAGVLTSPNI